MKGFKKKKNIVNDTFHSVIFVPCGHQRAFGDVAFYFQLPWLRGKHESELFLFYSEICLVF